MVADTVEIRPLENVPSRDDLYIVGMELSPSTHRIGHVSHHFLSVQISPPLNHDPSDNQHIVGIVDESLLEEPILVVSIHRDQTFEERNSEISDQGPHPLRASFHQGTGILPTQCIRTKPSFLDIERFH